MDRHGRSRVHAAIVAAAVAGSVLGGAAPAQAQETSFDGLGKWLRLGDAVVVTEMDGRKASGRLTNLSAASMTILRGGTPIELPSASVRAVSIRERDSLANGALIGLAAGMAFGAIALGAACHEDYYYRGSCAGLVLAGVGIYGAMGAGIGVGIDALTPGRKLLVYQRPAAASARVSVAPVMLPNRQGVVVRVVF